VRLALRGGKRVTARILVTARDLAGNRRRAKTLIVISR
jgi:hypothetical protein